MSNITGRDHYIIVQALAYASEWLKSFGDHRDEPSNRADMDAILVAMNSPFVNLMRWQAQSNIRNRVFSSGDELVASLDAMVPAANRETPELSEVDDNPEVFTVGRFTFDRTDMNQPDRSVTEDQWQRFLNDMSRDDLKDELHQIVLEYIGDQFDEWLADQDEEVAA